MVVNQADPEDEIPLSNLETKLPTYIHNWPLQPFSQDY